ncbi:transposase [Streptomyces yaanensis]|uniref:Transposase n=1 Tax=Streptomyces yaanensis TaxID=1142239 RepID=A0ABV7S9K1_9ACTN
MGERAGNLSARGHQRVLDQVEHQGPYVSVGPVCRPGSPRSDCRAYPDRTQCTTSATRPRSIAVLPRPLHEIQTRNRLDQQTEQWQRRYAIRAGIEATASSTPRTRRLTTRFHALHEGLGATSCSAEQ